MARLWDNLVGHEPQREMLRHAIAKGRLAHTFLFVGPAGIGKRRFALAVAQSLLCERHNDTDLDACGQCPGCKQVAVGSHPDLFRVGLPEGKRELPIELFVGDDEHRGKEGLCHDLSLRPMAGRRKIAIIDDADCFNAASANCLLKTLEEPPPMSLVILIGTTADAQLPTIRSRCQVLQFAPLATAQVIEVLLREGFVDDRSQAAAVAPLCDGSVQTGMELLDPEIRSLREAVYSTLAAEGRARFGQASQIVEQVEAGSDTASQRRAAAWVTRFAIEFYRETLLILNGAAAGGVAPSPQVATAVSRFTSDSLDDLDLVGDLLERVFQADSHLESNMSPKLCVEGLLDDLARIERSRRVPAAAASRGG
jgi:DNA polymerase-3 subunit delta'